MAKKDVDLYMKQLTNIYVSFKETYDDVLEEYKNNTIKEEQYNNVVNTYRAFCSQYAIYLNMYNLLMLPSDKKSRAYKQYMKTYANISDFIDKYKTKIDEGLNIMKDIEKVIE